MAGWATEAAEGAEAAGWAEGAAVVAVSEVTVCLVPPRR